MSLPHVVVVNFSYDADVVSTDDYLRRYYLQTDWAESIQRHGAAISIFQRFARDCQVSQAGVTYHLIGDHYPPRTRLWHIPTRFIEQVRSYCHQLAHTELVVLHINGMLFPLQTYWLSVNLPKRYLIVAQNHAEMPLRGWRSLLQRWGFQKIAGFLFTNHLLANEWQVRKIISQQQKIVEVMECSSRLQFQERSIARTQTGMHGKPILFWAGNLTPNKDPLTILAGFSSFLEKQPSAMLYMAYRERQLLAEVKARIQQDERLQKSVILLETIAYDKIAPYYNSADILVQGSAKEGSGIALLDALACGVVPVVSDIPAFRTMLGDGEVGALWPRGNASALTTALLQVSEQPMERLSLAAREFFLRRWSYDVLGQHLLDAYTQLIACRI